MSKTGQKIIRALQEALEIAQGKREPAKVYIPKKK